MTEGDTRRLVARRVVVHGRVQGVFFRARTDEQARRHHVGGWVRNRPDGTVEAVLTGREADVEAVVAWVHDGPPGALVTKVDITKTDEPVGSRFRILP